MRPKIREEILLSSKLTYVDEIRTRQADAIDCGAGYNPYGAPGAAIDAVLSTAPPQMNDYPHGMGLHEAIIAHWSPFASIGRSNIILCDGSIGGIYTVNCAFSRPGAVLLSFAPQFSDYIAHAKFMGFEYRQIRLDKENAYRIAAQDMIDAIDTCASLIFIDNPNNPTGQSISLNDLANILEKAKENDACVLVDEAYGDYMEQESSAATLLDEYENLLVLRTFSKGLGLAGLRAGYLLGDSGLIGEIFKLCNPFAVSQPSRLAAAEALKDKSFLQDCRERISRSKRGLRAALGERLHMAHTLDTCPIALLWHEDESVDLEDEFYKRGVLTYSGVNFDNLNKNSVRLRVPHEKECERLFEAVSSIS